MVMLKVLTQYYEATSDSRVLPVLSRYFGCCTVNFHQGWPKFSASLWMASADDGLAATAYSPSTLTTTSAASPPPSTKTPTTPSANTSASPSPPHAST
jgi:hypothetical protein